MKSLLHLRMYYLSNKLLYLNTRIKFNSILLFYQNITTYLFCFSPFHLFFLLYYFLSFIFSHKFFYWESTKKIFNHYCTPSGFLYPIITKKKIFSIIEGMLVTYLKKIVILIFNNIVMYSV
jgi:hypothetical protein